MEKEKERKRQRERVLLLRYVHVKCVLKLTRWQGRRHALNLLRRHSPISLSLSLSLFLFSHTFPSTRPLLTCGLTSWACSPKSPFFRFCFCFCCRLPNLSSLMRMFEQSSTDVQSGDTNSFFRRSDVVMWIRRNNTDHWSVCPTFLCIPLIV
jgi:hypothetical protein